MSSTVTRVLAPITRPCTVRAAVSTSTTASGKYVPRSQLSGNQESPIVSGRYRRHGSARGTSQRYVSSTRTSLVRSL
ncbi:hypothetical protein ACH4VM_34000 [Streptomyces sp. NPDC020792]|uniref:hypothetical protein n=1 Tax=Streptomyces sp. NPDC020792 TaxID=3365089 RepID=UPI0037937B08